MKPFCDFLGVTVPSDVWDELRLDVAAELDCIGMRVEVSEEKSVLWRSADSFGTVKASKLGKVWALGASGSVCAGLRLAGRFNDFLAVIGARPHRVTRLDATLDLPEDAAPVIAAITRSGRAGGLSLTRQAVKPSDVLTITGVRADGAETGTVYVGPRRATARMVVYDKRHERIARKLPDHGPQVRYELRLRADSGVTLRDAAIPEAVFWHYAAPDFLPAPVDAPQWSPGGSGFVLERTPLPLPAARLLRRVQDSAEVKALIDLAESCGPYGFSLLVSTMQAMRGAGDSPAATAVANCGRPAGSVAAVLSPSLE